MDNDEDLVVSGSTPQEVGRSVAKAIQTLPPRLGKKLRAILIDYIGRYDEGAFSLLNNRTVRQIIEEYRPSNAEPQASGEIDGIRYTLHDGPAPTAPDAERPAPRDGPTPHPRKAP